MRARLLALLVAVALVGCGGSGIGVALPVEADAHEATDGGAEDVGPAVVDAAVDADAVSDATPADVGPDGEDDEPPLPITRPIACETDDDCVVLCAQNPFCEDGECTADALWAGCLIEDEGGLTETCHLDFTVHPDHPCLMCNPRVSLGAWTGATVRDHFEKGLFASFEEVVDLGAVGTSWSWTAERAATGEHAIYFGNPTTLSYSVPGGERARSLLTTPQLPVPPGPLEPEVSFFLWLETEETPGFDILRLLAEIEGEETVELWSSEAIGGTTHGLFEYVEVPAPQLSGRVVRLGLEFDSVDDLLNDFEGAYVDFLVLENGCCSRDEGCVDADACTDGTCSEVGGTCTHEVGAPDCCQFPSDCDDGDPCTEDLCEEPGATCSWAPVPDCCHVVEDCDDGDPCTEDLCPVDGGDCVHQPLCCTGEPGLDPDDECDDGDPCTTATCVDEQCAYAWSCCAADADCADDDLCTLDLCVDGACENPSAQLPGCCVPEVWAERFDGGPPPGWQFDPLDEGVGWQVASIGVAWSPPSALYYGSVSTLSYETSGANDGQVQTGPVEVPDGVESQLAMKVYFDAESIDVLDQLFVDVNGPSGPETIASKSTLVVGEWVEVVTDLSSLAGRTVFFDFRFDTVDGLLNDGLGVVIDDLQVLTTCAPKACEGALDCPSQDGCLTGICEAGACAYVNDCCSQSGQCDDGDLCTNDLCVAGHCTFNPVADCCEDGSDCDDGNPCTVDACSGFGGSCSHTEILGCCAGNKDCDDDLACTIDQCIDHACVQTWVCCASDAECDDGDDVCTVDACVDSFCTHVPTGVEGCCVEAPVAWDFEVPVAFTYEASAPPCGWQVTGTDEATSGGQTLWYGDPAAGDFDCQLNSGSATSEVITLAPDLAYRLSFQVFMDVEDNTSYDMLWVFAVAPDTTLELWSKAELTAMQSWVTVDKDVSALAGHSFQLAFVFDSKDGIANNGAGAFVDDVALTTSCVPLTCTADDECADDIPGTIGQCDLASCTWTLF